MTTLGTAAGCRTCSGPHGPPPHRRRRHRPRPVCPSRPHRTAVCVARLRPPAGIVATGFAGLLRHLVAGGPHRQQIVPAGEAPPLARVLTTANLQHAAHTKVLRPTLIDVENPNAPNAPLHLAGFAHVDNARHPSSLYAFTSTACATCRGAVAAAPAGLPARPVFARLARTDQRDAPDRTGPAISRRASPRRSSPPNDEQRHATSDATAAKFARASRRRRPSRCRDARSESLAPAQ